MFIDSDVEVHRDAFVRIRRAFDADPELTALFGAYDDDPGERDPVSSFRNLLHHHVHTLGEGPATTFWAGLGAVRSEAFHAVGGFDAVRYPWPSIEDIELGGRLTKRRRPDPARPGCRRKASEALDPRRLPANGPAPAGSSLGRAAARGSLEHDGPQPRVAASAEQPAQRGGDRRVPPGPAPQRGCRNRRPGRAERIVLRPRLETARPRDGAPGGAAPRTPPHRGGPGGAARHRRAPPPPPELKPGHRTTCAALPGAPRRAPRTRRL